MSKDRIFELLSKKNANELTLQEQIELNRLLEEDADSRYFANVLDEMMTTRASYEESVSENEVDDFIKRVQKKIDQEKRGRLHFVFNWKIAGMVAAAVLVMIIGAALYFNQSEVHTFPNVVATQKGNKTNMVLPDGTKVWVNADSRLTYEQSFGRNTREVVLTGEAYFDVAHDQKKPFIVHTENIDVRVFGTAFNVRSYTNETTTETTLLRGSVQVNVKGVKDKKIMLSPNEKLVVQNTYAKRPLKESSNPLPQMELLAVKSDPKDSLVLETQWINNKLVFNKERLEEIALVLERWYNVKILLKKKNFTQTFSGVFENDKLEEVLQSLQLSAGIKYKIEDDLITIY